MAQAPVSAGGQRHPDVRPRLADSLRQFQPVQARHFHVGDHEVDAAVASFQEAERRLGVWPQQDFMSDVLEQRSKYGAHACIVLDQQDSLLRGPRGVR
ncbi:hypothetical protein G6F22_020019 [Rhizopus arrhizus]|nr:hypothetical protein G6F24_017622 [Rhizopus arrhizus]KAG0757264.1 hypothetical protein G6F22_020019 [Rhizopus arrhizus]